jgi:hypothetical protein
MLTIHLCFIVVRVGRCSSLCVCHLHTPEKTHTVEGYHGHSRAIEEHSDTLFWCLYIFSSAIDGISPIHDHAFTVDCAFIYLRCLQKVVHKDYFFIKLLFFVIQTSFLSAYAAAAD